MIEYPFPLRPGRQAKVLLPENVTEQEVSRLVRYVESLAVNGEWQNQNHDGSHSNGFETNGFGSNGSGTNGSGAAFAQLAESADGFHPGLETASRRALLRWPCPPRLERPRTDRTHRGHLCQIATDLRVGCLPASIRSERLSASSRS